MGDVMCGGVRRGRGRSETKYHDDLYEEKGEKRQDKFQNGKTSVLTLPKLVIFRFFSREY